jgi:hypothetical protein
MLDLLFDDTRWFPKDEVQFTVQASLSAMGVGYQPEGLLPTIFLFLFHAQPALGDQVYLASPISLSSSCLIFVLVTMAFPCLSCERGIDSLPPCQSGTLLFVISSHYQKGPYSLRTTK